jgi:hypothetical protein
MQDLLSRITDDPAQFIVGAVVVLILLGGAWRLAKGVLRTVLLLAILAGVVAVLVRMGKMDKPKVPSISAASARVMRAST